MLSLERESGLYQRQQLGGMSAIDGQNTVRGECSQLGLQIASSRPGAQTLIDDSHAQHTSYIKMGVRMLTKITSAVFSYLHIPAADRIVLEDCSLGSVRPIERSTVAQ